MKFLKNNFSYLLILLIFALGIYIRASWYGDLRLSTANAETDSYVSSSRASIFSWKILAGQRLFTTNLIYKLANDAKACHITSFGKPGIGEEAEREIQPCFDRIALLQNYLSMFGWCFLGWMLARHLQTPFVKISAVTLVILFGFTPQIAEWDSVLSPESFSLSLFAIVLGIGIELVFRSARSKTPLQSGVVKFMLAGSIILFILWVFVRDVHLYAIPVTIVLIIPLFLIQKFKGSKALVVTLGILLVVFVLGYVSARDSLRATRYPLMNSLDTYIWPYPSRVEFFKKYGMPEKDNADYKQAPIYLAWADKNAAKAYAVFLITHPGFVVTTLWANMDLFWDEYSQPYFLTDQVKNRDDLLVIGEMVNPDSGAVYLLTTLLALVFIFQAAAKRTQVLAAWAWLGIWVYGIAAATLFISFFGDVAGLRRHIMPSVELFRIYLWVFLLPFLDLSFAKKVD